VVENNISIINSILDSIDEVVLSGTKVPIINKSFIDEDKLFTLLDELRQNLPDTIKRSEEIVSNRDKIINEANNKAKEMISLAEERAKLLLDNNEIINRANIEARKINEEAQRELNKKQIEAINYADSILEVLEDKLVKSLEVIKRCKEEISKEIS